VSNDRQVTYTLKLQADPGNAAVSSKLQQQLNQQQAHENRFARQSAQDYKEADKQAKQFESTEERLARKVGPTTRIFNGRRIQDGSRIGDIADSVIHSKVTRNLHEQAEAINKVGAAAAKSDGIVRSFMEGLARGLATGTGGRAAGSVAADLTGAAFSGGGGGLLARFAPGLAGLGAKVGLGGAGTAGIVGGSIGLGGLMGGLSLAQYHNNYDGPGSIPSGAGRIINRFGGMVGSTSAYLQRSFGFLGAKETPKQVGELPWWARAIPGLETMRHAANAGFAGEGADRSQREQAFKYSQIRDMQENASRKLQNEALMRQTRMGFDLTPGFNTDLGRNPAGYLADFRRRQGIVAGEGAAAQANYDRFAGGRNDNQLAEAGASIQRQTQALEQQKSLVEEQGRAWGTIVDQLASIEQSERSFGVGMLSKSQFERDQLLQDARQFAQDPTKLDDRRLSRLHGAAGALGIEGNQGMVNEVNRRTSPLVDELKNLLGGDSRKKALDEGLEKLSPELAKALTTGGFSDAAVQKAMGELAKTFTTQMVAIITKMKEVIDQAGQVGEAAAARDKRFGALKEAGRAGATGGW